MGMFKIEPVKLIIAGGIAAVFAGAAWAITREDDLVCQATPTPGEYKVFHAKSGAVLASAQMIYQQGVKEPFGSVKVHPRLGPAGLADIMVVRREAGTCDIHLREANFTKAFKQHTFPLLEGQKSAVVPKKYWFSDLKVP